MAKYMILGVLLLVGAIVAPLFIKGPDGKPIMTLDELMPDTDSLSIGELGTADSTASSAEFYRYQDAEGKWHYTDQPPQDQAGLEKVEVDLSANNMDAVQPRPAKAEGADRPAEPAAGVASLSQMADLVDNAQEVQTLMDDRDSRLQQQLDQSQ